MGEVGGLGGTTCSMRNGDWRGGGFSKARSERIYKTGLACFDNGGKV